jgi:hypothetical protein
MERSKGPWLVDFTFDRPGMPGWARFDVPESGLGGPEPGWRLDLGADDGLLVQARLAVLGAPGREVVPFCVSASGAAGAAPPSAGVSTTPRFSAAVPVPGGGYGVLKVVVRREPER